ncbi:MAG: gluconolactonase [Spirochaetales bacterium]|nr:gluconolactonase [Spirochaetales bacterium]
MKSPEVEIYDQKFRNFVPGNSWLENLYSGMRFAEGPVYFADSGILVWSDIPNNRMYRWVEGLGVSTYRDPSNYSNGNTRDLRGRLITCEHGTRSVTRTEPDGTITAIADKYDGKRLNSPNDVAVKSDGSIWFTDPPYGILSDDEGKKAESEIGGNYVYCVDPGSGAVALVADDFQMPNGIAFSPDEKSLYIADTGISHNNPGAHHIRRFRVSEHRKITGGEVFAEIDPGVPDGIRLDTDGNVWTSAADGVHCYSPDGELLGKIRVPETVANLAFGGPRRNRLFITATTSLYAIYTGQTGARVP